MISSVTLLAFLKPSWSENQYPTCDEARRSSRLATETVEGIGRELEKIMYDLAAIGEQVRELSKKIDSGKIERASASQKLNELIATNQELGDKSHQLRVLSDCISR